MSNSTNTFSNTELHILEHGLRWINDSTTRFVNRLFHLLAGESGKIDVFLQLIGPEAFKKNLIVYLNSVIKEIRSHGRVVNPFKNHWPDLSCTILLPLQPRETTMVIENFLEAFSELAEDAWSPVLEQTWKKALQFFMASLAHPPEDSRIFRNSPICLLTI